MNKDEEKKVFENKELRDLNAVIDEFADVLKSRLIAEFNAGRKGYFWRDPANKKRMEVKLILNATDGDMVDVANFAAFIWNIDKG